MYDDASIPPVPSAPPKRRYGVGAGTRHTFAEHRLCARCACRLWGRRLAPWHCLQVANSLRETQCVLMSGFVCGSAGLLIWGSLW